MNLLLMREGYPPSVIAKANRRQYYRVLAQADRGREKPLVNFVGHCCRAESDALSGSVYAAIRTASRGTALDIVA